MSEFLDAQEEYFSGMDISSSVGIFRDSLLALIPVFEKARINWKEDQYDDFEGIAESLFDWFVKFKAENIISQSQHINLTFPNYGFFYKNYTKMNYIEVCTEDNKSSNLVFLHFISKKDAFDTVYCNRINRYGIVEEEGIEMPYDKAVFILKQKY